MKRLSSFLHAIGFGPRKGTRATGETRMMPPGTTTEQQALYAAEQAAYLRLVLVEYALVTEAVYLAARYRQGQSHDLRALTSLVDQREQLSAEHRTASKIYTESLTADAAWATLQVDREQYDA